MNVNMVKPKGRVTVYTTDKITGEIIDIRKNCNFISKPGLYHIEDMLRERANVLPVSDTQAFVSVGTGSELVNVWAGSLTTEISGVGNPGREAVDSVNRTNQTISISTVFDTTEASGTITEAGLFVTGYDSGANLQTSSVTKDSGVLFSKATFGGIIKNTTNNLTVDWEIIF